MDRSSLFADIKSGFSVFLIALPLCLGIAVASNCPPIAGILTAIVGGLVSTFLGSAKLTIKGPAAGLIVIVLGAVTELGQGDLILGYKRALAVACLAALLQIILAFYKKAVLAEIMPTSVIHGMLAAIGVIIIAKQSHVMMGVVPTAKSPLMLLAEIPHSLLQINPLFFILALSCLMIIVFWPKIKQVAFIPSAMIVVMLAILVSIFFDISASQSYTFFGNSFALGPQFLISLPQNLLSSLTFPDFSVCLSFVSVKYILMFFLVGSIESLLTVCAVDSLNVEKKQSDLNADLLATGVGNLIASLIGGIPMISEIARSKANINYGAKSQLSNFFHGAFLLIAALFFAGAISLIPLATLATLLIYVGYSLANPKHFIHTYQLGKDQFVIFFVTFIVTLTTDLLLGVAMGVIVKIFLHLFRGVTLQDFLKLSYQLLDSPENLCLKFTRNIVFSNYLELKKLINLNYSLSKSHNKPLILDFSDCQLIDQTIQMKLDYLRQELSEEYLIAKGRSSQEIYTEDHSDTEYSVKAHNV